MLLLMTLIVTASRLTTCFRFTHPNGLIRQISSSFVRFSRASDRDRDDLDDEVLGDGPRAYHIPVLLNECCEYLDIKQDGVYVDCTLGGGGHTREILMRGGRVIGLDQDPDAIAKTSLELLNYIETDRLEIIQTNFRYLERAIKSSKFANGKNVDGILMDLGISSHQIDEPSRGFAFGADGPLDMRMGQGMTAGASDFTASTIINEWETDRLANVLFDFGDETRSRQIAREIVASRPINSTGELMELISSMTSWKQRSKTLARCFQALRIVVNDEMGALDQALMTVHNCLKPKGRLVVMSYHSLEDRRVKHLLKTGVVSSDLCLGVGERNPWEPLFKRAQIPTEKEIELNRRSRSAKLRVAERIDDNAEFIEYDEFADIKGTLWVNRDAPLVGAKQLAKLAKRKLAEQQENEEEI